MSATQSIVAKNKIPDLLDKSLVDNAQNQRQDVTNGTRPALDASLEAIVASMHPEITRKIAREQSSLLSCNSNSRTRKSQYR